MIRKAAKQTNKKTQTRTAKRAPTKKLKRTKTASTKTKAAKTPQPPIKPKSPTAVAPEESTRFRKTKHGIKLAASFNTATHVDDYKVAVAEKFRSCGSYFKGRQTPRTAPSIKLTRTMCNLIRVGSHPVTASRALGIIPEQFWNWFTLGVDDIKKGIQSPFSGFVQSIDAAAAQDEIIDISLISQRVNNWQALAWKLERKNRGRWGARVEDGSSSSDDSRPSAPKEEQLVMSATKASEIAAILESVGALDGPTNPMKKVPVKKKATKSSVIEVQSESYPGKDHHEDEVEDTAYPEYD